MADPGQMAEIWGRIRKDVIITRTPLRISFAGGGTDFADFYRHDYGAVLSSTIDKYVYVMVKRHSPLFYEPIRLNYSETELASNLEQINNGIVRESLRLLGITEPIYISTIADLPSGSGLGSSSSFAVGLLNALHTMRGERVSSWQLAEEACRVEIEMLYKPIGKQDQFAAAYGGMNFIRFERDDHVSITSVRSDRKGLHFLFEHLMLFWTGLSRTSESILAEQKHHTERNMNHLRQMRELAVRLHEMLGNGFDPEKTGELLHHSWQLKRKLASTITTGKIDELYERGIAAGALGGKLCGAGGGGFLMFIVKPEKRRAVAEAMADLEYVPIQYEESGSTVLFPHR